MRCSSIACEHFTHFCGTTFSGLCHLHLQIWISFERLRYGKKEFLLGAYEVPHLTCQPINCTLEDAFIAKMIDLSGGFLPSSSPVVLGPNEWLKFQCGDDHTLSEIPDSSDLFTVTCLDGDHAMTHCKSVQCRDPPVTAYATPLGDCLLPPPMESMSSTSVKLAIMWIRSASLGRSQKAATWRSVLSLSNLRRHQKS